MVVLLVCVGVVALFVLFGFTSAGQEFNKQQRLKEQAKRERKVKHQLQAKPGRKVDAPISKVADRSSGTLACPKCGGTQFKAKRSTKSRAGIVAGSAVTLGVGLVAAAATKQTRVKCVTCGTEYQRG